MVACLVGNKLPTTQMICQTVCAHNETSDYWDRLTNFTCRGLESESGGEYATTQGVSPGKRRAYNSATKGDGSMFLNEPIYVETRHFVEREEQTKKVNN